MPIVVDSHVRLDADTGQCHVLIVSVYSTYAHTHTHTIVTPVMTVNQAGLSTRPFKYGNMRRSTNILCHTDF